MWYNTCMTTHNTDCLHTLNLKCPTCEKGMRLIAYNAVKFERYERKCGKCNTRWHITRTCSAIANDLGWIDTLEWETEGK